ncbi:MAG: LPS export ABC transporter permease LptG [Candidatus Polarisedimenticolaceae bacterium]|nr:LPS export ABC transporter permease LptG [Candidatus Polarisedimenticolaceae bacterium]
MATSVGRCTGHALSIDGSAAIQTLETAVEALKLIATRLDRYIGRAIAFGTLMSLTVLVFLIGFGELMYQLDYNVGKGNFTTNNALLYTLLILPRLAYELIAPAALLGSLIGLGGLANNSELIAMRAAGISRGRILLSVMKIGMLMLMVVLAIGELLAPISELKAQKIRSEAMASHAAYRSSFGFWAKSGDNYINVEMAMSGNRLGGVTIYEFDDERELQRTTWAKTAEFKDEQWLLSGVKQSEISKERVTTSQQAELAWPQLLDESLLEVLAVQPHMLPIWGLSRYIDYLRSNGQNPINYEVAFWSKIIAPFVLLTMLVVSVPFVVGPMRNVSIGQRIFVGTLFGISFFLINRSFAFLAVVYELNPPLIVSLPTIVCLMLAVWMFRRLH